VGDSGWPKHLLIELIENMTPSAPNAEDVRTLFNRIAPVYDQLNQHLSFGLHRVWKTMTVKWSQASSGATCLDLCCGSGDLTHLLARQVGPTGTVYGVDFSPDLLAVAQQRAQAWGGSMEVHWVEADVLDLPFADQTFDALTMGYGLRNVIDIPACLRQMQRVLKPGAKAAILDFHQPQNPFFERLQRWYLDQIVVPAAAQFDLEAEYAYLAPSVERFPQGPEQVRLGYEAGFSHAVHYPLMGGMMGVLVLSKAE